MLYIKTTLFNKFLVHVLLIYWNSALLKYVHVYLVCSNQTYGQDCSSACGKCLNGETCHHVSGLCPHGCSEGVKGDKCEEGRYF